MIIWRMRIACWIPKATHTHSEYVILVAFPPQQWLHERASLLHYTYSILHVCLWLFFDTCFCCLRFCVIFLLRRKDAMYYYHFFDPYLALLVVSRLLKVDYMIAAMLVHHTFRSSSSCFTSASAVFVFSDVFLMAALDSSSVDKSENKRRRNTTRF